MAFFAWFFFGLLFMFRITFVAFGKGDVSGNCMFPLEKYEFGGANRGFLSSLVSKTKPAIFPCKFRFFPFLSSFAFFSVSTQIREYRSKMASVSNNKTCDPTWQEWCNINGSSKWTYVWRRSNTRPESNRHKKYSLRSQRCPNTSPSLFLFC